MANIINIKNFILREDIKKLENYKLISNYNIDEIINQKKNIDEQESTYKELTKGNKIIESLSELVSRKSGIYEYKQEGNETCPLCNSSDKFSQISEDDICKTAKEYVDKNNKNIESLKRDIDVKKGSLKLEIEELKENIKKFLNENLSKSKEKSLENKLNIEKYRLVLKFILENTNIRCSEDLWKLLEKDITIFKGKILNNDDLKIIKQEAIEINKAFNGGLFEDDFSQVVPDNGIVMGLIGDKISHREVHIDIIINKKMAIQNYLKDSERLEKINIIKKNKDYQGYLEGIQKSIATILENEKDENKEGNEEREIPKSINEILELFIKFQNLIKDEKELIQDEIKLNKDGVEYISDNLNKMFQKLTKDIKGINLNIDISKRAKNEGKAILKGDESGAMNILSQGQVSVLMIAYFLNNLFYNKKIKLNLCLFDDITHSLDDLNINSFIDMLKYSLCGENKKLSQLFFTTHDKNLIELIKIKMESRGIGCEVIDLDVLE